MSSRTIIARYSLWKTLPPLIFLTVMMLSLYLLPLISHQWPLEFIKSAHANGPGIVFGWIIGPFVLAVFYRIFAQIAFRQRAAIWVDGDMIMNASGDPTSTNRHDVESVALSHFKRYGIKFPAIRLGLKCGGSDFFQSSLLRTTGMWWPQDLEMSSWHLDRFGPIPTKVSFIQQ